MTILIKKAKIIDPNSIYNQQIKDVLIENGKIKTISEGINSAAETVIEEDNIHLSPGLFDFRANFGEPGIETKEDITSGTNAAEKGGFTGVAVMPNTSPTISNRSTVEYIVNRASGLLVDVHPIGSITKDLNGEELSEMYDMKMAGALAFSDNKNAIQNPNLLSRSLLYTKSFDGIIISFANDEMINHNGQMNEGIVSTSLGLSGIPHLAEELQISRNLFLSKYNETGIHFSSISTKKSVELIAKAQEENINKITSDIATHQIMFTDDVISDFDSNYKVIPPFRLQKDIDAIIEGLKNNTINVLCSDHTPREIEDKDKEFDLAKFGIINLQTAFPSMLTKLAPLTSLELIIDKMAIAPRKILGLAIPKIMENEKSNIVIYNPTKKWTFTKKDIVSKSKNSPYINYEFTGKVLAVMHNNQYKTVV